MFNWTCPYCGHAQTVTADKHALQFAHLEVKNVDLGSVGVAWESTVCANDACRKLSLSVDLVRDARKPNALQFIQVDTGPIKSWKLLPLSAAKPQPDCIPLALREDYEEACAIRDLSPKASATLARRCLQGMIRDFCGISAKTLDQEIRLLNAAVEEGKAPLGVTPESVEAIDGVRSVGNIGAHMEKQIDLIVPVEADEAQILIELIESLFDEWYVARDRRQRRFAAVRKVADDKRALVAEAREAPKPPVPTEGQVL